MWRPRPTTLLSREEQKTIRKNLREYSKDFEEEDRIAEDKERGFVVEERKRLFQEWLAWREGQVEELREERLDLGLPAEPEAEEIAKGAKDGENTKVVEEIMEEIIDETEEVVP